MFCLIKIFSIFATLICAEIGSKNIIINALLSTDGTPEKQSIFIFNKMKLIPLTQGKFAQVDDEDFEWLSKRKWYARKANHVYYATTSAKLYDNVRAKNGGLPSFEMHRMIMGCGYLDPRMIDHKDGNGLNNQRSNLRFATSSENNKNKRGWGASKFLGVCLHTHTQHHFRKRTNSIKTYQSVHWIATIVNEKKHIFLGKFYTELDAAYAYNEAAKIYHGEFARLNILPIGYIPKGRITDEGKRKKVIESAILFIRDFIDINNRYPSYKDIMKHFNKSSSFALLIQKNPQVLEYKATLPPELFKNNLQAST